MLLCISFGYRSVGPGGVFSSDVQAQLRFAPIEKQTRDIKDMYPPCLVLRLNGKMLQLPVGQAMIVCWCLGYSLLDSFLL